MNATRKRGINAMTNYEQTIETIKRYLSSKDFDYSGHIREGRFRLVINNWFGGFDSFVEINVDRQNCFFSYRMYYPGIRAITRDERRNLSEYFIMANKKSSYICYAGLNEDGYAYVEIKNDFEIHPLTAVEQIHLFEKNTTARIVGDRVLVNEIL